MGFPRSADDASTEGHRGFLQEETEATEGRTLGRNLQNETEWLGRSMQDNHVAVGSAGFANGFMRQFGDSRSLALNSSVTSVTSVSSSKESPWPLVEASVSDFVLRHSNFSAPRYGTLAA